MRGRPFRVHRGPKPLAVETMEHLEATQSREGRRGRQANQHVIHCGFRPSPSPKRGNSAGKPSPPSELKELDGLQLAHSQDRHFPCESDPHPQPSPSPATAASVFARDLNSGAPRPKRRHSLCEWIPSSIHLPASCVRKRSAAARANPAPFPEKVIMAN